LGAIFFHSALNANIDAPIAGFAFDGRFPLIPPWSILGANNVGEAKSHQEEKCTK
jgi:hypothetical protein